MCIGRVFGKIARGKAILRGAPASRRISARSGWPRGMAASMVAEGPDPSPRDGATERRRARACSAHKASRALGEGIAACIKRHEQSSVRRVKAAPQRHEPAIRAVAEKAARYDERAAATDPYRHESYPLRRFEDHGLRGR